MKVYNGKLVFLTIALLTIVVTVTLVSIYVKQNKNDSRQLSINQANAPDGCPGEVPRYPILNTQDIIDIIGYTSPDKYVMVDPAYQQYLYFEILVHKADDNIMAYNNANSWESMYNASCYKYYRISPGEDELDDILSLNLREGKELYSFILTPAQNREIIQKVIDDKLMDLPRLDNIDILTVLNQFDKEYKTICVSETSIHTLDDVSKPKIEAFISWFEGEYYDELKKHPVDIFPSDIPARAPYNSVTK